MYCPSGLRTGYLIQKVLLRLDLSHFVVGNLLDFRNLGVLEQVEGSHLLSNLSPNRWTCMHYTRLLALACRVICGRNSFRCLQLFRKRLMLQLVALITTTLNQVLKSWILKFYDLIDKQFFYCLVLFFVTNSCKVVTVLGACLCTIILLEYFSFLLTCIIFHCFAMFLYLNLNFWY